MATCKKKAMGKGKMVKEMEGGKMKKEFEFFGKKKASKKKGK